MISVGRITGGEPDGLTAGDSGDDAPGAAEPLIGGGEMGRTFCQNASPSKCASTAPATIEPPRKTAAFSQRGTGSPSGVQEVPPVAVTQSVSTDAPPSGVCMASD